MFWFCFTFGCLVLVLVRFWFCFGLHNQNLSLAPGAPGPPGSGVAGEKCVRHVSQVAMVLVSSGCALVRTSLSNKKLACWNGKFAINARWRISIMQMHHQQMTCRALNRLVLMQVAAFRLHITWNSCLLERQPTAIHGAS